MGKLNILFCTYLFLTVVFLIICNTYVALGNWWLGFVMGGIMVLLLVDDG